MCPCSRLALFPHPTHPISDRDTKKKRSPNLFQARDDGKRDSGAGGFSLFAHGSTRERATKGEVGTWVGVEWSGW